VKRSSWKNISKSMRANKSNKGMREAAVETTSLIGRRSSGDVLETWQLHVCQSARIFREYVQNAPDAIDDAVEALFPPSIDHGLIETGISIISTGAW